MYAIVKAGGHQEKVEVGDTILVNRLDAKNGETVEFPVALVVDGEKVIIDPHPEVQEQDRRCPPQGPSPEADPAQDHSDRLSKLTAGTGTERNNNGT